MSDADRPRDPRALDCARIQPLLLLYVDGELDAADQPVVEAHLAECPACAKQAHFARAFKARLGSALQQADVAATPPQLERRLQRRLRLAHANHRARRLAVPAACAATLVAFLTLTSGDALTSMMDESVQRHTDDVGVDFASPDAERLERLLSARLGYALRVPTFRSAHVSLRGARLVRMNNRPAAYLVYGTQRSKISVIAVPDPHRRYDLGDERLPRPEGRPLHIHRESGLNVVVWRQGSTVYSMVSDLGPQEMLRLFFQDEAPPQRPALPVIPASLQ